MSERVRERVSTDICLDSDDSFNRPLSSDEWLARMGSLKVQGLTYDQLVHRLAFKHSDGVMKKNCNTQTVRPRGIIGKRRNAETSDRFLMNE